MPETYDFQNLSFDDFERLSLELLQVALGVRLESFKVGRDGGIDMRYAPAIDNVLIVQCKRYAPDAFSRLLRDMRTKELPKVKLMAPKRYVLTTSCRLSPENKAQLMTVLSPYCVQSGDIFGANELNGLIAQNPEIERRHFKLWMGSIAVMQQVLHSGIFNYSQHEIDRLRTDVSRYVAHAGFYRALEMLDHEHHCIIVGIPGIGKTTTARLLLAHHLREGFRIISVTGDIEEAWRAIEYPQSDELVAVYYDDFLGQVAFTQKLGKNEDRRLLDLMDHCKRSKSKRFILTTRDYLFDQALSAYEPLGRERERLKRSSVTLDDYNLLVRARLLANHFQFSDLPLATLREVVSSGAYLQIIRHQNFLPRVIEEICRSVEATQEDPNVFIESALAKLNDPAAVWSRPLSHLTPEARLLVYALVSLDGEHEVGRLETAWRALKTHFHASGTYDRRFRDVLRETEGSFTSSQLCASLDSAGSRPNGLIVRFMNPSSREFVLSDLLSNPDVLTAVFETAISYNQLFFWQEARNTLTGGRPIDSLRQHQQLIVEQAIRLLDQTEPELTHWAGEPRIKWGGVKQIARLHQLTKALDSFATPELTFMAATELLAQDPKNPFISVVRDDLKWLPEVTQTLVDAIVSSHPSPSSMLAKLAVGITNWPTVAYEVSDIRYAWKAAKTVLLAAEIEYHTLANTRSTFVERVRELVEEVPHDWPADEISQVADDLEHLVYELDDHLRANYQLWLAAADEAKQRDETSEEDGVNLAANYSDRGAGRGNVDIAGIFEDMVSQLTEDSASS